MLEFSTLVNEANADPFLNYDQVGSEVDAKLQQDFDSDLQDLYQLVQEQ